MWLINLLPPMILLTFFSLANWTEIFVRLGSSIGIGLAVILLSIIFLRKRAAVGIFPNIILLCYFFINYFLPEFDKGLPSYFKFFVVTVILSWLGIVGSIAALQYYPLVKKPGNFSGQISTLPTFFMGIPSLVCGLAFMIALVAQKTYSVKFSLVFVGWQIFGWFISLASLYSAEYAKKVSFYDVQDYIIKERELHIKIKRRNILVLFSLFIISCTLFEGFRGLWLIWIGTALWMTLIFISLWKIWRFVFESSAPNNSLSSNELPRRKQRGISSE